MRRAAGLARALACAGGGRLSAALQPAAAPAAAAAWLASAAAAQRALHSAAPLLPPAAAAAAGAGRPGTPSGSRLLRTAGASPAAAPAASAAPIAVPEPWRLVGRVEKPFPPQSRDVFAVVQAGPHQFKVTLDDLIYVEKMHGVDINDKARPRSTPPTKRCATRRAACANPRTAVLHRLWRSPGSRCFRKQHHGLTLTLWRAQVALPRVLMVGTPSRTLVGRPYVPTAEVVVVVEEHVRDAKVIIFKKRRRKNSRRNAGHRQVSFARRM
jgi:ribosomal protein L21